MSATIDDLMKVLKRGQEIVDEGGSKRLEAFDEVLVEISTALSDIVSMMEKNAKSNISGPDMARLMAQALANVKLNQAAPTVNVAAPQVNMPAAQITVQPAPVSAPAVNVQPADTVVHVVEAQSTVGAVWKGTIEYGRHGLPMGFTITRIS